MRRLLTLAVGMLVCAVAAAPAPAGTRLIVGAAEDDAKQLDPAVAKAKMDLAKLAGLDAIRVTALWNPGVRTLDGPDLQALSNAAFAAQLDGIRLFVSIYPSRPRAAPITSKARADFAAYATSVARELPTVRDFIIGNEPNLNTFWMPQFTRRGTDAAAPAYEAVLAETYDALESVDPGITVIGGSVSPRGQDDPRSRRPTHSPTAFIRHLGDVYRASGRARPIMDAFSFHPYLESSRLPPTFRHPLSTSISLNDYDKLVALLGQAFDGTAQPGTTLPVVYDEFGVQSRIGSRKVRHYTNRGAPAARDAVSEALQAAYYRRALELAACQPTVTGLLFFHVSDEHDMRAWQSGLYYADDTPKSSLAPVRDAVVAAETGTLVSECTGGTTWPGPAPERR